MVIRVCFMLLVAVLPASCGEISWYLSERYTDSCDQTCQKNGARVCDVASFSLSNSQAGLSSVADGAHGTADCSVMSNVNSASHFPAQTTYCHEGRSTPGPGDSADCLQSLCFAGNNADCSSTPAPTYTTLLRICPCKIPPFPAPVYDSVGPCHPNCGD